MARTWGGQNAFLILVLTSCSLSSMKMALQAGSEAVRDSLTSLSLCFLRIQMQPGFDKAPEARPRLLIAPVGVTLTHLLLPLQQPRHHSVRQNDGLELPLDIVTVFP